MALCCYCGLREAGSKEHLPGAAALNSHPVRVRYSSSDTTSGGLRRIERIEKDGFVVRTICKHCNRRTGGNYGAAFKDFALQWNASGVLADDQNRCWISLRDIQPLRVLKQLAGMFLAAQASLELDKWHGVREFVLKRDRKLLPSDGLRVFLYRNRSVGGRIASLVGMGFVLHGSGMPPLIAAEISWPPLGAIFTRDDHPLLKGMKEVTSWGQRGFRVRESFGFSVPNYRVEHHFPFTFGSIADAEAWTDRMGAVWLVHAPPGNDNPTQFSVMVQQVRPGSA